MAPTYLCRFPGSKSDGFCGSALLFRMPLTVAIPITELKAIIRRDAVTRRDAIPPAERAQAAETIAARPFPLAIAPGTIVSGFSPLKSEINPLPLMRKLAAAGAQLALPVVAGARQAADHARLRVRRCARVRANGASASRSPRRREVAPDILLVPLLAFDRGGHRIGYGAGYYDMTIARLRAMKPVVAVGIAYAAQEIAEVPVTERDARLDLVLTERDVIDFRGNVNASSVRRRCGGTVRARGRDRAPARPAGATGSSIASSSTARTRPAASASPRRSTTR